MIHLLNYTAQTQYRDAIPRSIYANFLTKNVATCVALVVVQYTDCIQMIPSVSLLDSEESLSRWNKDMAYERSTFMASKKRRLADWTK